MAARGAAAGSHRAAASRPAPARAAPGAVLREIRIEDLATIEAVTVAFESGLSVLTGETGAGKSILIGALDLALGGRSGPELVRTGAARLAVEAVFELAGPLPADLGLPAGETELALRREVAAAGRSRAFANGRQATAGEAAAAGRRLVDILGQHDRQALLDPAEHARFLDDLAGAGPLAQEVERLFRRRAELASGLRELARRIRELDDRAALVAYQQREVDELAPRPGETAELRARCRVLGQAVELARETGAVHEALHAGEESLTAALWAMRRRVAALGQEDAVLAGLLAEWEGLILGLEELARALLARAEEIPTDPETLAGLRRRLEALADLERRHGSLEAALERGAEAGRLLSELEAARTAAAAAETEQRRVQAELVAAAGRLSAARRTAAAAVAADLQRELAGLGMPQAVFEALLTPGAAAPPDPPADPAGYEQVEFLLSANPGETPRPLARIASGGELARVMLALKNRQVGERGPPVLVFDEVDAGIGGATAEIVGRKLRRLAGRRQVLCVTHLPQIAALADHHYRVVKTVRGERTRTTVERLDEAGRVTELARMLGSDAAGATAAQHARALRAQAGRPEAES